MTIYGVIDPIRQHRTQLVFKGKQEHLTKVNGPKIVYRYQNIATRIRRDQEIMLLYQIC